MSVCHGTENHTSTGNQETSTVSNTSSFGSQEHGVTDDNCRGRHNDKDLSLVNPPTDGREDNSKNGTDSVGRNTVKLLLDDAVVGVDGADDSRKEEGETLDSNVVAEENAGDLESDGVGDTAPELDSVDTVDDFGLGKTLRLYTGDAKLLLLLCEPAGGLGSVGEGDKGEETKTDGDDTFNGKDHAPSVKTSKVVELENSAGQKTTKGTSQRSHDHVERQTESQLRALVPSGQVVSDSGKHAGLKDSEQEADTAESTLGFAKGRGDTDDTEEERCEWEEPAGTHPLAGDGGGDFEDDV